MEPPPVFLPGKSHGRRNLAGDSPRGCKRVRHNLATKQQPWIPVVGEARCVLQYGEDLGISWEWGRECFQGGGKYTDPCRVGGTKPPHTGKSSYNL